MLIPDLDISSVLLAPSSVPGGELTRRVLQASGGDDVEEPLAVRRVVGKVRNASH